METTLMSSKSGKFYITTAIPYVNSKPHLGHALEFVQADTLARYHEIKGEEALLLSGSDDNALKNVQAAEKAGKNPQEFIAENTRLFQLLLAKLGVRVGVFQKGSDVTVHYPSSQQLWNRCAEAGDIYKKTYEGLYCIGCEAFYTHDELNEKGECDEHPGKKLEAVAEENYFFRLSKYQQKIISLIETDALRIVPATRKNEVLSFLSAPLRDISISRSSTRAKNWGVPVPGDESQRMYVWFDALNIYQSGVGFDWNGEKYKKWWPADVHLIGKGIIRFHAIYWSAFLMSANLLLPRSIFVHGYITVDGQKMSKTGGNVIDPFEVVEKYGVDPVRYYLLREIPSGEDGDFSYKKLEDRYNGDLANGLGNFVARVTALGSRLGALSIDFKNDIEKEVDETCGKKFTHYTEAVEKFRLNEALGAVWELLSFGDKYINDQKPWAEKDEKKFRRVIINASYLAGTVANLLWPFLPPTAEKIREQIRFTDSHIEIKKGGNLFPRLN